MKIAGYIDGGYLVEMSKGELGGFIGTSICGENVLFNKTRPRPGGNGWYQIGVELQIHEMYQQLNALTRMADQVARTQETLRNIADDLDSVHPVLEDIAEPVDELKQSEEE